MKYDDLLSRLGKIKFISLAIKDERKRFGARPLTTVMFGIIGREFVNNYATLSDIDKQYIHDLMEKNIDSKNLGDIIATGYLEAFYGQAYRTNQWEALKNELPPKCSAYVEAWINFDFSSANGVLNYETKVSQSSWFERLKNWFIPSTPTA